MPPILLPQLSYAVVIRCSSGSPPPKSISRYLPSECSGCAATIAAAPCNGH
jgi:hypothetical protein